VVTRLEAMGRPRYEVSNFALPGHRSVHNEATWRGGFYAGLGPAAHGYLPDGRRTRALPTFEAWLADLAGLVEPPDDLQAAIDHVLSTLRHVEGLDLARLFRRTGHAPSPAVTAALCRAGLLIHDARHLCLTAEAFPLADGVVERLCRSLSRADDKMCGTTA